MNKDHYQILGVQPDADAEMIKAIYHSHASRYHPDRLAKLPERQALGERFKEITAAYNVLSDPQQREMYDRLRAMQPADDDPAVQQAASTGRTIFRALGDVLLKTDRGKKLAAAAKARGVDLSGAPELLGDLGAEAARRSEKFIKENPAPRPGQPPKKP